MIYPKEFEIKNISKQYKPLREDVFVHEREVFNLRKSIYPFKHLISDTEFNFRFFFVIDLEHEDTDEDSSAGAGGGDMPDSGGSSSSNGAGEQGQDSSAGRFVRYHFSPEFLKLKRVGATLVVPEHEFILQSNHNIGCHRCNLFLEIILLYEIRGTFPEQCRVIANA